MKDNQNKKYINPDLLQILVCPIDKKKLAYNKEKETLSCLECKKEYQIKNEIPILLNN
ncbi:MAG: hypothetical protein COU71_02845 [Parcubacteria group bacterium CG10_big_fil_rev_8_21_14_0_10_38_31]|nr:MAG: hypothetical protein COU71_02845 [Parcubacteria group bacterium CG10_big_fil_rev_8_21_14_0_10_38_31]